MDIEQKAQEVLGRIKSAEMRWRVEHAYWRDAKGVLEAADSCYIEPMLSDLVRLGHTGDFVMAAANLKRASDVEDIKALIAIEDLVIDELLERLKKCGCHDKTQYVT